MAVTGYGDTEVWTSVVSEGFFYFSLLIRLNIETGLMWQFTQGHSHGVTDPPK